jgi:NADH dehydrogenase
VRSLRRPNQREIGLGDGSILNYDYLILAAGARHSYLAETTGNPAWSQEPRSADEIRRRILLASSGRAGAGRHSSPCPSHLRRGGGGATGVEVAGALAEIRSYACGEISAASIHEATVMLLEGGRGFSRPILRN